MPATIVIIGGVLLLAVLVTTVIVSRMIYICPPNEVLIFSGGHRRVSDGDNRVVGYRLVQGGRGIRVPMMEIVDRMNLTNMIIELRVHGAYSKGGIPLNVQGVANVKVSSSTSSLANAIERFLGRSREEIMQVARETLEGNLRGVLATLTPEEVNHDREKFARELVHEADADLARLGLELDTLKIQHVSDDKGYLDSLGRKQSAELIMRSRVAEAENQALAAQNSALNQQNQEIARIEADIATARAEASRRIAEARTRKDALIAEQRAEVQALLARAKADLEVQKARLGQVRFQLIADKVKPAEARRTQLVEAARGASSRIREEGKASADAIRSLAQTWQQAGDSARQIFVAQKLTSLVQTLMGTVGDVAIDKVTFIDHRLTAGGGNFAVNAAVTNEQLKQTMGLDLAGLARGLSEAGRRAGGRGRAARAPAPGRRRAPRRPRPAARRRRRRRGRAGPPSRASSVGRAAIRTGTGRREAARAAFRAAQRSR
ncbi:MAG: flotillin family protein [Kofleriaceae bacterium]|nr:flotillin family protein [Kofleriaceae bacterium]